MKVTQFIISSKLDENTDKYLVYNTRTTGMICISGEVYRQVFINKDFHDTELVAKLKEMLFLVEDDYDELAEMEKRRKKAMEEEEQTITILTTTKCNARCFYCFEEGIDFYDMDIETANGVIAFCKEIFSKPRLGIYWFGGEPLMNFDVIRYISQGLTDAGFELFSHITTNGSLIDKEKIEVLKKYYKELSIQITIDDVYEHYWDVKRFVDFSREEAFDHIIENIKLMLDNDIIVSLRINFIASKIENAKEVFKTIDSLVGHYNPNNKPYIYFAPLALKSDKEIISNFNSGEKQHPFLQAMMLQNSMGYPTNAQRFDTDVSAFGLMPAYYACGMMTANRFVIDADGTVYKCHRLVGRKEFSCGNVTTGVDRTAPSYKLYRSTEIKDEDCKKCNLLPICQGGCKAVKILYGEKQKCSAIKQIQKDLLKYYYKEKEV